MGRGCRVWQVMGKGRRIRRHEFLLSERAPEAPAGGEGKARKEADPERKMARCELFSYDDDHLFGARGEVSDGRASRPPLSANGQRSDSTSRVEGGGGGRESCHGQRGRGCCGETAGFPFPSVNFILNAIAPTFF